MWNQWEALSKQINKAVKETGLDQQLNDVRKKATERINQIASQVVTVDQENEKDNEKEKEKEDRPQTAQSSSSNLQQKSSVDTTQEKALPLSTSLPPQLPQGGWNDGVGEGWDGDEYSDLEEINLNTPRQAQHDASVVHNENDKQNAEQHVEQLQKENADLKKRLAAVEEAAADALGESEELREQLQEQQKTSQNQNQQFEAQLQSRDFELSSVQQQLQELGSKQIQQAEQEGHYLNLLNKVQRQSRELFNRYSQFGESATQLQQLQLAIQQLDQLSQNPILLNPPTPQAQHYQIENQIPEDLPVILDQFENSVSKIQSLQSAINQIESCINIHDLSFNCQSNGKQMSQEDQEEIIQTLVEQEKKRLIDQLESEHQQVILNIQNDHKEVELDLKKQRQEMELQFEDQISSQRQQLDGLKNMMREQDTKINQLQTSLDGKIQELETLREGAKAEAHLAAQNIREAYNRAEDAEKKIANFERQITSLQNTENANLEMNNQLKLLQEEIDSKSKKISSLESQIKTFTDTLKNEREMALLEFKEAQEQFQKQLEDATLSAKEEGRQEGRNEVQSDVQHQQESSKAVLDAKNEEIELLQTKLAKLEKVEQEHAELQQQHASLTQQHSTLQSEHQQIVQTHQIQMQQSTSQTSEIDSLKQQIQERSKRFLMLQKGFDSQQSGLKEENQKLQQQIQEFQYQVQTHGQEKDELNAQLKDKDEEIQFVQKEKEKKEESLSQVVSQLDDLRSNLGDKDGRIFQLETQLKEMQDRLDNVGVAASSSEEIQRVIDEAVAVQVQSANQKMGEMQGKLEAMQERAIAAEKDREAAENAKIELALSLARLDQSKNIETTVSSRSLAQDELLQRAEEAEMALSVYRTRATKAEEELQEKTLKLSSLEQQVQQLSWQVKMVAPGESSSNQGAASSSASSSAAAFLDVLGCGANFKRK